MNSYQKNPFLRWSFLRLLISMPKLLKTWQVGDGREEKLVKYVLKNSLKGDTLGVLQAIDEFAWTQSYLINVGDEKGKILDDAIKTKKPRNILELGAYCGYSALRMAIFAPEAKIVSIEISEANAKIARSIHEHAGVSEQVEILVGSIGDDGQTIAKLKTQYIAARGLFDFVFIDHDKKYYLSDLQALLNNNLLDESVVVVTDNVKFPGAPDYLAYMDESEGKTWCTKKYETYAEYQNIIKDLVLVSQRIH
ncbi:MAG: class I SAM-dependent methyltransferase [Oscillatoria sp. PMC 1068.18]|nr:class I SAM-dependent methyltransferase [Oscillatoria sp. PMC 1068.18]